MSPASDWRFAAALTAAVCDHRVAANPSGALSVLRDRAREWLRFERWSGTSINAIDGGDDVQSLPLPLLLAMSIALAPA